MECRSSPNDQLKVMFIGKPARGLTGYDTGYGFLDCRECGEHLYYEKGWHYWNYTKEIITRLYGSPEEGWSRIALANIIKSNISETVDTTTYEMKEFCIDRLRVIWREIEILQPKNIIFYTHWYYDDFIEKFKFGDSQIDITDKQFWLPNGSKKMAWWHREFYKDRQLVLRMLMLRDSLLVSGLDKFLVRTRNQHKEVGHFKWQF